MTKTAIILGSTRTGRAGAAVADWVHQQAIERGDAKYALLDLAEVGLPQIDEPIPPAAGRYTQPYARAWAEHGAAYDGFAFVTPSTTAPPPAS